MAGKHLFLHLERTGDVDIMLRDKIDSRHGVEIIDFREYVVRRSFGLDVRNANHNANVTNNLSNHAVVRMIIVRSMRQNHVWARLTNDIQELQPCLFRGEQKTITVMVHDKKVR